MYKYILSFYIYEFKICWNFFIPFVENEEDAVLVFTTKVAINKQTGSLILTLWRYQKFFFYIFTRNILKIHFCRYIIDIRGCPSPNITSEKWRKVYLFKYICKFLEGRASFKARTEKKKKENDNHPLFKYEQSKEAAEVVIKYFSRENFFLISRNSKWIRYYFHFLRQYLLFIATRWYTFRNWIRADSGNGGVIAPTMVNVSPFAYGCS